MEVRSVFVTSPYTLINPKKPAAIKNARAIDPKVYAKNITDNVRPLSIEYIINAAAATP